MPKTEALPLVTQDAGAGVPIEWQTDDLILNTYEVKQVFTTGGMALIYRVFHRGWGIDLAVKSLRADLLGDQSAIDGIIREAQTWVNLGLHPHVVSCYYVRMLGGIPRIFMEYVDGGSLADAIEQGWLYTGAPVEVLERILDIAIQSAWGIHFAHEKGLVHQDIKPANILLARDGLAKVTDFGIAQMGIDLRARRSPIAPFDEATLEGRLVWVDTLGLTPSYSSPEQATAKPVSRRTDIWSWGVSVMEMFTGAKIWKSGPKALAGLGRYQMDGPAHPEIPRMPERIVEMLRHCFQKDQDDRPRDLHVLADELQAIYAQEIGRPYPRGEPRVDTILADTLNNRAVSLVDLGQDEEALSCFDDALRAENNHPAALYNRSLFLWRGVHLTDQEVVAGLKANLRERPTSWEPAYFLCLAHLERGDIEEADQIASATLAVHPAALGLKHIRQVVAEPENRGNSVACAVVEGVGVVNALAVDPRGKLAVTGGNDGRLRAWDLERGACLCEMDGHTQPVRAVRLSRKARLALSAGWDQTLRLWDLSNGACLRVMVGHDDIIQDADLSADGRCAISASADGTLRVWDVAQGACLRVLTGHADTVCAVAITPDGLSAISASHDHTLRTWDLESGACLSTLRWMRACTTNLCLTPDAGRVLLGSGDNRVWEIDLASGMPLHSFTGHFGGISAVSVSPNGAWAFSGGMDGTLRQWDLQTGRCLRTYTGHTSALNALAFAGEKMRVVTAGADMALRVWPVRAGIQAPYVPVFPRSAKEVVELTAQVEIDLKQAEACLAQGDAAQALVIAARLRAGPEHRQHPRLIDFWDRVGRKAMRSAIEATWLVQSYRIGQPGIRSIAVSGDGRCALFGTEDKKLDLWDLHSASCVRQMTGHEERVNSAVFLPGERAALSGSGDGSLRLWQLSDGACLRVLTGHTSEVNSVAVSPDGRLAFSGSNDHTARLWDLDEGRCRGVFNGHEHYVRRVTFSPDGRLAFSAGWDRGVRAWLISSGELVQIYTGSEDILEALAVSPDGRWVAAAGRERRVRLWDVSSGEQLIMLENGASPVVALTFSPDSRCVFAGHEDGGVTIWQADTAQPVRAFRAHTLPVRGLSTTRDGCLLATAGADQILKLWRLDWQYAIPQSMDDEGSLLGYLGAFVEVHRPLGLDGLSRSGRPTWTEEDLAELDKTLGLCGFGWLGADVIEGLLYRLSRG